jgi:hypothetical protein
MSVLVSELNQVAHMLSLVKLLNAGRDQPVTFRHLQRALGREAAWAPQAARRMYLDGVVKRSDNESRSGSPWPTVDDPVSMTDEGVERLLGLISRVALPLVRVALNANRSEAPGASRDLYVPKSLRTVSQLMILAKLAEEDR